MLINRLKEVRYPEADIIFEILYQILLLDKFYAQKLINKYFLVHLEKSSKIIKEFNKKKLN